MRNFFFPLAVASVLLFTGCEERQSMRVTQDKAGRAYVPADGTAGPAKNNVPVARPGEIYVTASAKDTLTSIAKKYNVTLEWLIERNQFRDKSLFRDGLPAGTNVIVPDPAIKR